MYKNLRIFKSEKAAKEYAASAGYMDDVTRFSNHIGTRCKCGETAVVVFENEDGRELALGICASCGE